MKNLIELALEDLSSSDYFLFQTHCGICTVAYGNRTVRFSKAGEEPVTEQKKLLFDALYDQEYRTARQSAVRSAAEHLNLCPVCRRLACNRCFLICEDLDLCVECAERLGVKGDLVISDSV